LSPEKNEVGGLSGKPLFEKSTKVLAEMYRLTEGSKKEKKFFFSFSFLFFLFF